jgi:RNA-directed DNA polymerase
VDIQKFFDNISHQWMLDNIEIPEPVLKEFLKAGYALPNGTTEENTEGTPQGGPISPLLANIVLDGLENRIKESINHLYRKKPSWSPQVYVVRFADDIVITGASKQVLDNIVKPKLEAFLAERGLSLNHTKTRVTNIKQGFTFLGF